MTSREQFEAWFNPKKDNMKSCGLSLISIRRAHDTAWGAWQASREAVEVELPSITDATDWMVSIDVMESESVISAIRAAGINVKGA